MHTNVVAKKGNTNVIENHGNTNVIAKTGEHECNSKARGTQM
jgi:hypothetical protein